VTGLDWLLTVGVLVVMWCAVVDFVDAFRSRRRPVRGADGRWRAPRRIGGRP